MACGTVPPLVRDLAASDQGPGHRTVTFGVVAARLLEEEQSVLTAKLHLQIATNERPTRVLSRASLAELGELILEFSSCLFSARAFSQLSL